MFDSRHLMVLAAIAETGRFDLAADRLGITQSAVSQRLKALETQVGGPLVIRSLPSRLTGQGTQLLAHYQKLRAMEDALDIGRDSGQSKKLALGANADSVATWLLTILAPLARDGGYLFDIRIDDQDATQELLRQGEVLGCISSAQKPLSGCRAWPLGSMRYHLIASPEFCRRWFPHGLTADAVKDAPLMVFNHKDELQHRFLRQQTGVMPPPGHWHYVPSSPGFVEAIRLGLGYGMAPISQIGAMMAAGILEDVVPGKYMDVPLYWHAWDLKGSIIDPITKAIIAQKGKLDTYPMT